MQPLTVREIRDNAYRMLGIPATATQLEIERAARQMRVWSNPDRIPSTRWDINWLGKLPRSRSGIEQALAALNEPRSRIRQRLLWFHCAGEHLAAQSPESLEKAAEELASVDEPARLHDTALVNFCAANLADPTNSDGARWQRAVDAFRKLSGSREYLQYVLDLEQSGVFEKRADESEIVEALAELPSSVTAGLAASAESALEEEKLPAAMDIAAMLRTLDRTAYSRVLDRAEDLVERRCSSFQEELRRAIVFHESKQRANEKICRAVAEEYNSSVGTILKQMQQLGPDQAHRTQRIQWACARLMSMLGTAWISASHFVTAQNTFELAKQLAAGTSLADAIQAQIDENAHRVEFRRTATMSTDNSGIAGGRRANVRAIPPPLPPQKYVVQNSPQNPAPTYRATPRKANPARFAVILIGICASLIGSLIRIAGTSSDPAPLPRLPALRTPQDLPYSPLSGRPGVPDTSVTTGLPPGLIVPKPPVPNPTQTQRDPSFLRSTDDFRLSPTNSSPPPPGQTPNAPPPRAPASPGARPGR